MPIILTTCSNEGCHLFSPFQQSCITRYTGSRQSRGLREGEEMEGRRVGREGGEREERREGGGD